MERNLWLGAAAITASIPVIIVKYALDNQQLAIPLIMLAIIVQIVLVYVYYNLFQFDGVGALYAMAKGISVVLVVIAGILLFGEVHRLKSYIGIVLIVIGVVLA